MTADPGPLGAAMDAAAAGDRFLDAFARATGAPPPRWVDRDPASYPDQWRTELDRRLIAGDTRPCPHLGATPVLTFWMVGRPERLTCQACYEDACRAMIGTPDDRVCDHCGATAEPGGMHPVGLQVPVHVDVGGAGMTITGPVMITGGLCHRCYLDETGRAR